MLGRQVFLRLPFQDIADDRTTPRAMAELPNPNELRTGFRTSKGPAVRLPDPRTVKRSLNTVVRECDLRGNRYRGVGRASPPSRCHRRGRVIVVAVAIASLLSDAGLRRSEAAALTWADIERAADGSGRVTVRRSKTDQAGQGAILYVTAATTAALDAIRQGAPDAAPVFGLSAGQIGRRIAAAAAGLGAGYSGHSGRVGLAVRMTAKGAPTHAVMLAGRCHSPPPTRPATSDRPRRHPPRGGAWTYQPRAPPRPAPPAQRSAGCGGITVADRTAPSTAARPSAVSRTSVVTTARARELQELA